MKQIKQILILSAMLFSAWNDTVQAFGNGFFARVLSVGVRGIPSSGGMASSAPIVSGPTVSSASVTPAALTPTVAAPSVAPSSDSMLSSYHIALISGTAGLCLAGMLLYNWDPFKHLYDGVIDWVTSCAPVIASYWLAKNALLPFLSAALPPIATFLALCAGYCATAAPACTPSKNS